MRWPTLLEVLVPSALVLILFVLFWPVFARVDRPRVPSCLSNVKQLNLGMLQYAQDYDEQLPNALEWPAGVRRYVHSEHLFHCPQDTRWVGESQRRDQPGPRGYDMPQRWSYRSLGELEEPHRVIVFYEIGDEGVAYRHLDGMHVGFVDGHAKWFKREQMPAAVILTGAARGSANGM